MTKYRKIKTVKTFLEKHSGLKSTCILIPKILQLSLISNHNHHYSQLNLKFLKMITHTCCIPVPPASGSWPAPGTPVWRAAALTLGVRPGTRSLAPGVRPEVQGRRARWWCWCWPRTTSGRGARSACWWPRPTRWSPRTAAAGPPGAPGPGPLHPPMAGKAASRPGTGRDHCKREDRDVRKRGGRIKVDKVI